MFYLIYNFYKNLIGALRLYILRTWNKCVLYLIIRKRKIIFNFNFIFKYVCKDLWRTLKDLYLFANNKIKLKKLQIIKINKEIEYTKTSLFINKKFDLYLYFFLFSCFLYYFFCKSSFLFEIYFIVSDFTYYLFDFTNYLINYFKLNFMFYLNEFIPNFVKGWEFFNLLFIDMHRRLRELKSSDMDWSLKLLKRLPSIDNIFEYRFIREWFKFLLFNRKYSLDFNIVIYRLLWFKDFRDFDSFLKIQTKSLRKSLDFTTSSDSFFRILHQICFFFIYLIINLFFSLKVSFAIDFIESINFSFIFEEWKNFSYISDLIISFSFYTFPIFYLVYLILNWILTSFFDLFIFLIQDLWVYLLKLKIYEIDFFFSIYIYGKEKIYFIYFQLETLLENNIILKILRSYLLWIYDENTYTYFILKNLIFKWTVNEKADFYSFINIISVYNQRLWMHIHPLERPSMLEKYKAFKKFAVRENPFWHGFLRRNKYSFWERAYLSKFKSVYMEETLTEFFTINWIYESLKRFLFQNEKQILWIPFLNIIYFLILIVFSFWFFGSFWFAFFKTERILISDYKFQSLFWLWTKAKGRLDKYLDKYWQSVFEYKIFGPVISDELYIEWTTLFDKTEFEDEDIEQEREFLQLYINALKQIRRKEDRFSKYEIINLKHKMFRLDEKVFDHVYDYTLSFQLMNIYSKLNNFYNRINFIFLEWFFFCYNWFMYIMRSNWFLLYVSRAIYDKLRFFKKFLFFVKLYTEYFFIVRNYRSKEYAIMCLLEIYHLYNLGNIFNKVAILNQSIKFDFNKQSRLFLDEMEDLVYYENHVQAIIVTEKIRRWEIFRFINGPLKLQGFFFDLNSKFKYKESIILNHENKLNKLLRNQIQDDNLLIRIINLLFLFIIFSFIVYEASFIYDQVWLFIIDKLALFFYTILIVNTLLIRCGEFFFYSTIYFWQFLNYLFWEVTTLYPLFFHTFDYSSLVKNYMLYITERPVPLKIHILFKYGFINHMDIFNDSQTKPPMGSFDFGFELIKFLLNRESDFYYYYRGSLQQNSLSDFSFLFYIYKKVLYIKCLFNFIFWYIKDTLYNFWNVFYYYYGPYYYGFSYPKFLLKLKKDVNANIYDKHKKEIFNLNFHYAYTYKYIENYLKRKQYLRNESGFVESYFYRNKNTWNFYERNSLGEKVLKYPLIIADKAELIYAYIKEIWKNKRKRVFFTKSSDFISNLYTKSLNSSLDKIPSHKFYNIYDFLLKLREKKRMKFSMTAYRTDRFRAAQSAFSWKSWFSTKNPGPFYHKAYWTVRWYEEMPFRLYPTEKKNPILNIWNELHERERPARYFNKFMYMLHEYVWRSKYVFHRKFSDVQTGKNKFSKIFRNNNQIVEKLFGDRQLSLFKFWPNFIYNRFKWKNPYHQNEFKDDYVRRKFKDLEGDFFNDLFLKKWRYRNDLKNTNIIDKDLSLEIENFFKNKKSLFWEFDVLGHEKKWLYIYYDRNFNTSFHNRSLSRFARRKYHIGRILSYRDLTDFWRRTQIFHNLKKKGFTNKIIWSLLNAEDLYEETKRKKEDKLNFVEEPFVFLKAVYKFIKRFIYGK